MAKITFSGINEYVSLLNRISQNTDEIIEKMLYEGTKIVADEVKQSIEALPTDEDWGTKTKPAKGIRKEQKEGLIKSFGVTPIQKDGDYYNTKIGFDGYNDVKTAKYPNGQPNIVIARVAESGTIFSLKTPFFRKAVNRSKKRAEAKMEEIFNQEIEKITKG